MASGAVVLTRSFATSGFCTIAVIFFLLAANAIDAGTTKSAGSSPPTVTSMEVISSTLEIRGFCR